MLTRLVIDYRIEPFHLGDLGFEIAPQGASRVSQHHIRGERRVKLAFVIIAPHDHLVVGEPELVEAQDGDVMY